MTVDGRAERLLSAGLRAHRIGTGFSVTSRGAAGARPHPLPPAPGLEYGLAIPSGATRGSGQKILQGDVKLCRGFLAHDMPPWQGQVTSAAHRFGDPGQFGGRADRIVLAGNRQQRIGDLGEAVAKIRPGKRRAASHIALDRGGGETVQDRLDAGRIGRAEAGREPAFRSRRNKTAQAVRPDLVDAGMPAFGAADPGGRRAKNDAPQPRPGMDAQPLPGQAADGQAAEMAAPDGQRVPQRDHVAAQIGQFIGRRRGARPAMAAAIIAQDENGGAKLVHGSGGLVLLRAV